jgi:hypothetical protein
VNWPVGEFDELRRLHVLHAALPGTMLAETVLPVGFDEVWSVIGDVERNFPGLVPDVRSIRILDRDGERLRAFVRGRSGLRAPFDMILRPGWCLMQSRWLVFGMAATPAGDHTRFGYLAGLRLPGRRLVPPLLAPVQRRLARSVLRRFEARFSDRQAPG